MTPEERAAAAAVFAEPDWSRAGDDWPLPVLDRLEAEWAAAHSIPACVAVSSGTAGLALVLRALGAAGGDEVIIPAFGCPAVDVAVLAAGLVPIHADIDPETYCLSPAAVAAAVTSRTAAVIAVHFGGQPAHVGALARLAARAGITLVEDACLAPGAAFDGVPAGSFGRAAVFSLGVRKPISAGEGGVVASRNTALIETIRRGRSLGIERDSGELRLPTGNFRMTALQAAVALPQLSRLSADIERRVHAAATLAGSVADVRFLRPLRTSDDVTRHAHAQFWLRFDESIAGISADRLVDAVQAEGIPLFRGWDRPSYAHPVYVPASAGRWLRERTSERSAEHYHRTRAPTAESAALGEALLLDFPILDADPEIISQVAEALRKVTSAVDQLC